MQQKPKIEIAFERALFASRWLMAPMYLGLIAALGILVVFALTFFRRLTETLGSE